MPRTLSVWLGSQVKHNKAQQRAISCRNGPCSHPEMPYMCKGNTPNNERCPPGQGIQYKLECLTEDWQIVFIQMPRTTGSFKYLLVFVDIFGGWVEEFPTQTEKASDILRFLLKEIIPRLGLANSIQSDNGSAFLWDVVQKVSAALQINWKLHASWRLQSTGKWKNMNHTLKNTLVKICPETNLKWDKVG